MGRPFRGDITEAEEQGLQPLKLPDRLPKPPPVGAQHAAPAVAQSQIAARSLASFGVRELAPAFVNGVTNRTHLNSVTDPQNPDVTKPSRRGLPFPPQNNPHDLRRPAALPYTALQNDSSCAIRSPKA